MTPSTPTPDPDLWRPVPRGTFARLASDSAARRSRRRVAVTGLAACLAVTTVWAAVGVAYVRLALPDESGFEYAGIRCGEVRDLLPEYLAGTLPRTKSAQVRAHVTKCSICKERIRRAEAGLPIAMASLPVPSPVGPAGLDDAP